MARCKWVMLLLLLLFFHSTALNARDKLTAVFPTWEPYGFLEDEKAAGFEIETFKAVMDQMGIDVAFAHQPWKRCLYSVENGLADVVISALKIEERMRYLYYPDEPISVSKTALFCRKDRPIAFDGAFERLKGYTIGVTSGFSYGDAFDRSDFLQKDESTETEAVVIKVLLGRIELGAGNVAVVRTIAEQQGAGNMLRFLSPLLHSQNLYAGFSKAGNHQALAKAFSQALVAFKKTAEYRAILKKYRMD